MKIGFEESSTTEFKEAFPQKKQIAKTCVAFCNLYGGSIYVGIRDDGTITGVSEEEIQQSIEFLGKHVYENCSPPIIPRVYAKRFGEQAVLVVEVSSGMSKPYFLSSEGIGTGVYIRVGRSTLRATPETIQELQWQSKGISYDTLPCHAVTVDDLDPSLLAPLFFGRKAIEKAEREEILKSYRVLVSKHGNVYCTHGGTLLFNAHPERFYSEAFVICSRFKGTTGRDVLETVDITGPLPRQIESACQFVYERVGSAFTVNDTRRTEKSVLPRVAIREVIVNAVVHRNYHVRAPIKIAVFADRVEVFSPGGFPGPIQPDMYESGITYIRNVAIAKVLRRLGYVEKLGSGFRTIFESCRAQGLQEPQIVEDATFVKVILFKSQRIQSLVEDRDDARVLASIRAAGEVSTSELAKMVNIPRSTLVRKLNALLEQKKITRSGKGRSVRYSASVHGLSAK
ncbi:MAG: putative DNA binding domain-containing protein [Myxococcota bacterium]|nr:putative DNA binding domain-containing protein [Myxococcota bacterium]